MRAALISIIVSALLSSAAVATPINCLILCEEPSQHDPDAAAACNCAEKYCPTPQGPGGPNIPTGDVWGWDEATDACGPVPEGDQCAGLDVACVAGYSYGWNGVDTCQCLPDNSKRQLTQPVCLFECIPPSEHDANAVPTGCNCHKEYCPTPQGPGGPFIPAGDVWAFNATADACGPVPDPELECASLGVECVENYIYGWSDEDSACECQEIFAKRQICDIVCIKPTDYDPHAISVTCNCDERVCPPEPVCSAGTSFGWDQDSDACGCVVSPEEECVATGFQCVAGYTYGWDAANATCKCLSS